MISSASTECLLNSFPMFGHTGWSVLEYAWALEERSEMNTSVTSEPLKRKSTASTQDENTSPTTAGTQPTGYGLSPPVHFIGEFGCQQRRKRTFLNHTPRDFEMRPTKSYNVYQPSGNPRENYSRPRTLHKARSVSSSCTTTSPHAHSSSAVSHTAGEFTPNEFGNAIELDSKEIPPPSLPEIYGPSAKTSRLTSSVSLARVLAYKPRSPFSSEDRDRDVSIRSARSPTTRPQDKKRQRRQTPFKVTIPSSINTTRHAPLEPLVAKHRRKASYDAMSELLPEIETEQVGEMGTFGVIQRYFDSQTGGPVSVPETHCHAYSPDPQNIPLPMFPEPPLSESTREHAETHAVCELDPDELPPAVPDRSPKRLTNPTFPVQTDSTISTHGAFAFIADEQYSSGNESEKMEDNLHVPKKRRSKRLDVGQAGRAGSSQVGRLAPPILSHDALTTSADLGLNDLSYYLKHTGPCTDSQPTVQQRKKPMALFKVKQRKTLAARVGSVEGSPQRARKQAPIPTCAREMTTSGGARHLRIVIPTESPRNTQAIAVPTPQSFSGPRSRYISNTFDAEMLSPLHSPGVERMLSDPGVLSRSFSEPVPVSSRSLNRPPKSPETVPVQEHPLVISPKPEPRTSREDQTRARKLRDLQRIKRKPLPIYYEHKEQHSDVVTGALPTPAHTPEPLSECNVEVDSGHDEGIEDESWIHKMARMQERVMLLQRQNTELTEALAKFVGLELDDGDTRPENVLKAIRQVGILQ